MAWTHQLNAWGQISYDENDSVGEPGNAWYEKFSAGTPDEQDAAAKTLAQNKIATPTRTHLDPLGRTYLTEQDNGFDATGTPNLLGTTVDLDIQGNQRSITDARGVPVVTDTFDMLGRKLVINSVDAGTKTVLFDAAGATVHQWNPKAIEIAREYDPLRRQRRVWVTEAGAQPRLAERTFYGETLSDAAAHNLYGHVFCQLDGAGLVTNTQYDFKGNLLSTSRQLASAYDRKANWTDVPDPTITTASLGVTGLELESFATTTACDALNRIVRIQVPSGTPNFDHVAVPTYNETGLLGSMGVQLNGAATTTPFVTGIDYNEKEQRLKIIYGNSVTTAYTYEPDTFRLSTISTTRTTQADLQALAYTYDPVGNITTIEDSAQQTLFVGNSIIGPRTRYRYDAIYRLTYALGREHSGQALPDQTSTPDGVPIPSPTDSQAMRLYAETYQYDSVGNFLAMIHAVTNAQGQFQNLWTRTYTPDTKSNRLLSTVTGDDTTSTTTTYAHDVAGNIAAMTPAPLPTIEWDYRNQLFHSVSSRGDTYCAYDATGQRVRKVLVPASGPTKERIYLGAYEIYREHTGGGPGLLGPTTFERRTLHVNDDKRRIALVELRTQGNDGSPARLVRYQLDNHLGSSVLELDSGANLISYEEYHPYGTAAYRATAGVLDTSPKQYAFTAKERDEETGLYYHGARYYAPWLGRWISPDPAGLVDGNPFSYVRGNPLRYSDLTGLQSNESSEQLNQAQPVERIEFEEGDTVVGERWKTKAPLAGRALSIADQYRREGNAAAAAEWKQQGNELWETSRKENAMSWLKFAGAINLIAATTALGGYFFGGVAAEAGAGHFTVAAFGGGGAGLGSELALRLLGKPYSSGDYLKQIGGGAALGLVFEGLGTPFLPKAPKLPPLANNDIVVVGSGARPGNFILRPGIDTRPIGNVTKPGVSASESLDLTLNTEIKQMFGRSVKRGDIISGAFVEDVRAAGFDIVRAPTEKNPFHLRIISGDSTFDEEGRELLSLAFDRLVRAKKP